MLPASQRGLVGLEQDLSIIGNFGAIVSQQWFPFNFQFHALKRYGARDAGTAVSRILTVTIGKDLVLPLKWLGTGGKPAVFTHQFVAAIISRLIP